MARRRRSKLFDGNISRVMLFNPKNLAARTLKGEVSIVRSILSRDPNHRGRYAACKVAVEAGNLEICRLFCDAGVPPFDCDVDYLLANEEIGRMFVENYDNMVFSCRHKGYIHSYRSKLFEVSCRFGLLNYAQLFYCDSKKVLRKSLVLACSFGHLDIVKFLISRKDFGIDLIIG